MALTGNYSLALFLNKGVGKGVWSGEGCESWRPAGLQGHGSIQVPICLIIIKKKKKLDPMLKNTVMSLEITALQK